MRRRWMMLGLLLAGAAAPVLSGWAGQIVVITQSGRAFARPQVQIRRGDVLRFRNADAFLHQVYVRAPGFGFETAEQEPGQAVDVAFPVAGVFSVRCEIHPKMLLTVQVE